MNKITNDKNSTDSSLRIALFSNRVHVILRGSKWAAVKSGAKRASKIFKHREEAYLYARQISDKVVVHNKDATVLFSHGC